MLHEHTEEAGFKEPYESSYTIGIAVVSPLQFGLLEALAWVINSGGSDFSPHQRCMVKPTKLPIKLSALTARYACCAARGAQHDVRSGDTAINLLPMNWKKRHVG